MCGIYGAVAFTPQGEYLINTFRSQLEQTSKMRGRDGHGIDVWSWGFIGASRAHPLPEPEETSVPLQYKHLHMVFNGTLSNDAELNEEYGFQTKGVDTETAIRLWEEKDWESCNEFVGGFAFGVYNKEVETLTVVKNFKTLWFILTSDIFVFASEREFLQFEKVPSFFSPLTPQRFPQNTMVCLTRTGVIKEAPIVRKFWSHTPDLEENKAIVVTSGGIDSITSAYVAKKVHEKEIILVNFDYGQRARLKEWEAVQHAAKNLDCPVIQIDLSLLGKWGASPLTDLSIPLPLGKRSVESTLCWTPGRNMLMIAYSAAFAESIGAKWIYYGNNMEEEATGYADNDLEFVYLYNQLLQYGTLKGVQIKRALGRVMKAEIIRIGTLLGVDFNYTWSCDEGFGAPCGICGCCTTRRYSFIRAGIVDTQQYLNPPYSEYPWIGKKEFDDAHLLTLVSK